MEENNSHHHTKEQWVSFSMLLIFGVTVVVLGILQMRNTIYNPFAIIEQDADQKQVLSIYENDQVKLQSLDTDHDGLNDYEEIQFFGTSPYIPDTDSDGINDKTEIDQKTDPLCPKGENCKKTKEVVPPSSATSTGIMPMFSGQTVTTPAPVPEQNKFTNSSGEVDLKNIITDPQQLRTLILQSGAIPEEQLKKIDDATLRQMAEKLYKEKFVDINEQPAATSQKSVTSTNQ